MTPEEIPRELMDILDAAAGKKHSHDGHVARALAEILTRYDEMRLEAVEAYSRRTYPPRRSQ